jgi:Holliday junction DNA helicase RuvA
MIAYLKGNVVSIDEEACILDVNGIGYYVYCSQRTLQGLKSDDPQEITLYTRLIHREDCMDLYGFISRDEYLLFNLLITVSGIGPKQSIKILGTRNAQDIVKAVVSDDSNFLMSLVGIGKKKAQQIILELKEKVKKSFDTAETPVSSLYVEAITALESLGFSPSESRKAVDKALLSKQNADDVGKIVESALKYLS